MNSAAALFDGKKVLHVIGDSKFGGDAVYMIELSEMVRELGAKVYICTTTDETIELAESCGFDIIKHPKILRKISLVKDLFSLFYMRKLCKLYQFDLVHTHTSKGGAIGRIGARLGGVKSVIHTIHGFAFHQNSSFIEKLIYKNVERFAARFGDMAISVNNEDRVLAIDEKIVREDKVTTVYNGVSKNRIDSNEIQNIRQLYNIDKTTIIVGTLSRFSYQKDPQTFLKAAFRALETNSDLVFIYAGDGPMLGECKEILANSRFSKKIIFTGFVTNAADYLKSFDIFITTALYEGLPIALLEAMYAGKAIIATDAKGNRECVNSSNALINEISDYDGLANNILDFANSPSLREKLGVQAKQDFCQKFTVEQMRANTLNVYRKVMYGQ